jgi:DNA replication protein DnaC
MKKRIRNAKFPYEKSLNELDKGALPVGLKPYINELTTLDFISKGQNIIFAGNPGTGNYRKKLLMERNVYITL